MKIWIQYSKKLIKKSNISKTVKVTEILQETKKVQTDFLRQVHYVCTHLDPNKPDHNWQSISFKFNCFSLVF